MNVNSPDYYEYAEKHDKRLRTRLKTLYAKLLRNPIRKLIYGR